MFRSVLLSVLRSISDLIFRSAELVFRSVLPSVFRSISELVSGAVKLVFRSVDQSRANQIYLSCLLRYSLFKYNHCQFISECCAHSEIV